MQRLDINAMENVHGGLLAGFLLGLGIALLTDNDFIQGLADGIVG